MVEERRTRVMHICKKILARERSHLSPGLVSLLTGQYLIVGRQWTAEEAEKLKNSEMALVQLLPAVELWMMPYAP